MDKKKDKRNKQLNKKESKLLEIIDDNELDDEDHYKSTQIVTNYYYKH
ncbi:hypothetical protein [Clostridium ganghwense]|uniref:Uncharacterized protein n=1 Tax=Clostridium ganghwense TaxID=312089 RepID=A0ABT4CX11_9CLOT|nr:hypothetical protein [Clostridium ganghwense]MCY6372716.1 hypothetical protein [Clostridium ganghwense]